MTHGEELVAAARIAHHEVAIVILINALYKEPPFIVEQLARIVEEKIRDADGAEVACSLLLALADREKRRQG